ncbi:uncharacterized protein LOC111309532 [Durio zibethinus]|uniref:Uncharacterized protein LOC111309532 n=1 Tax=Durio zibethinus TaxID=66656 RepID=A0A6P6AHM5_DURZI|nr:uncharacterized protein LOC111309532 [Durio zibethinus]
MDHKYTYSINQEELEETLSFCDLPLEDQDIDQSLSFNKSPNSPSYEHFEFPFIPNTSLRKNKDIVFCGKLIKEQGFDGDDDGQSRYLFPLSSARLLNNKKKDLGSIYLVNSKPNSSLSTKSFRSQSCSFSRKQKVLIGLAKMPPKMELSDIKKRQSRRNPSPMFPPAASGDLEVVAAGKSCSGDSGGGGRRSHLWGLLRCRAQLASALAKASCIPHV